MRLPPSVRAPFGPGEGRGSEPIDNPVAAGIWASMMSHEYPLVLGRDAAGVVEAVGQGVDRSERLERAGQMLPSKG